MKSGKYLIFVFVFFVILCFFSRNIPLFWDVVFYAREGYLLYEKGLSNLINPFDAAFPFYSLYLDLAWKLFGRTLHVSHFVMLPFTLWMVWEYYKLSKMILQERMMIFALLLLVFDPVIVTQIILIAYDIILLCFFLFSLNALLRNKRKLYSFGLFLLILSNIRGIIWVGALFIFDIIRELCICEKKSFKFRYLFNYFPAGVALIIWKLWHYKITGWYMMPPENKIVWAFAKGMMILRQFIYIIKVNFDNGRVFLWIGLFAGLIYYFRRKEIKNKLFNELLLALLIIYAFSSLFLMLFMNPISHRYFLPVLVVLSICVAYVLQFIKSNKVRIITGLFFISMLFAGNFWLYPEKYGNGWDTSLKCLSYFEIRDKMYDYINENKINPLETGTLFPLYENIRYTDLVDKDFQLTNMEGKSLKDFNYVVQSNISNAFSENEINELNNNWLKVVEFRKGQVYIKLFKKL
ncbi:MAG: hypothetical protein Q8880_08435 [Bacteroidota bacterium]|nr:hypothetical protein [Bacteroidota bacterium]